MQKKTHLLNLAVSLLTLFAIAGTALAGSPASVQASSASPSKYFYLVSALDGSLYVDIQNGQTNPGKKGIPIIVYKKDSRPSNNQLWTFVVPNGEKDGYGYFESKSNLVLDIQGGSTASGTSVVAFTKNTSRPANQLWKLVPDGLNGGIYGYIQSKSTQGKNHQPLVLDIQGGKAAAGTSVIANSIDKPLSQNQIWIEVHQF